MSHTDLISKFQDKSAIIGIIGLGYVGLPMMVRLLEVGFRVVGIDIDEKKIEQLNAQQSYIKHVSSDIFSTAEQGYLATTDFSELAEVDAIILCVPTPLNEYREPDLSYVISTLELCLPHLRENQLISLESTTYPGTTEEELKPRIESTGLVVGKNVFLVYSPEREDPANPDYQTSTIPKVCGGSTPACQKVGIALYEQIIDTVVPVSSTRAAEMTKLLENIHRAVNIGLVNEMKMVADRMGLDIFEVIDAAATKPFGFVPYYPGPGIGGHCIPIDPFYLTWKARAYGLHTRFIELAGEINSNMPNWIVNRITDALNQNSLPLNNSRVLILGIAYKKNVDDMRESPSVRIMDLLHEKGVQLAYSDPHVPKFPTLRDHSYKLSSVELTEPNVAEFDCVVITTAHKAFDYDLIKRSAKLIIDTRGVYRESAPHIIKA